MDRSRSDSFASVLRLSLDSDGAVRAIPGLSTFGLTAQSPSEQLTNPTSLPSKQQSMVQMQPPSDTVDKGPITEYDILYAAAREAAALPMGTDVRVVSHLIYLFFLWLNSIYPIASRKVFYEHLRDNGPLCSPFLLNVSACCLAFTVSSILTFDIVYSSRSESSLRVASVSEASMQLIILLT